MPCRRWRRDGPSRFASSSLIANQSLVSKVFFPLLTFGIFFTPVLFDAPMLGERLAPLVMLNPLAPILEELRLAVVEGHKLLVPLRAIEGGRLVELWSPWFLAWSAGVAVVGLVLATTMFRCLQYLFAEWV